MKQLPNELEVRLDFDFENKDPVLVGVNVHGFGWILGGAKSGQLSIQTGISLDKSVVEKGSLLKLRQALKDYDYLKRGHCTFKTKD